jgi:hypothetical protein
LQATEALLAGGFTTPTNLRPYMKPRRLLVKVSGLRPNANLYVFFNDVNVSAHCRQLELDENSTLDQEGSWRTTGNIGDQLVSSSSGDAVFAFYVPAKTFLVGSGILVVKDATNDSYTTRAEVTYNSFNYPQTSEDFYNTRLVQVEGTKKDRQLANKSQIAGGFRNPLSWTFLINSAIARNKEGIYVSSVDLYFATKDTTFGCVVEIREVENGIPKTTNLPLSRVRLIPDDISTSGPTTVTFPGIVFLASGKEYAISPIPDGGGSNYSIKTGRVGETDATTNSTISKEWEGKLYLPTNGNDWTPITDEYPKFKLNYAAFNASSGFGRIVNKDYEFFTIANTSGTFLTGEFVTQEPVSALSGTVSTNTSSYEITGSGTNFTSDFSANAYITLVNSNTDIDIIRIQSVTNSTFMTLRKKPSFSNTSALTWKTPIGKVDTFNSNKSELSIIDSTATNTSFLFGTGRNVIGADSGAYANVVAVINKDVNLFQPLLSTTAVADTSFKLFGTVIGNDYAAPAQEEYAIATNLIDRRDAIVASKSNEILYYAGGKSFTMNVQFASAANTLSPVVDLSIPTVMVYANRINANNQNEHTKSGSAFSRYVSKTVILKDGNDAEDIKVLLTGYRPPGTELDVYVKLLNSTDQESFDSKDWTRMQNIANNGFSDAVNKNDFIEMEYIVPSSPRATLRSGSMSVSTTTTSVTGVGTTFQSNISNGDIILLTSGGTSQVHKVNAVTSNTTLTLVSNCGFTSTAAVYSTLSPQNAAFKDSITDSVKYFGKNGVAYLSFKTFAVKIVFLANDAYLSPAVDNIRVISSI